MVNYPGALEPIATHVLSIATRAADVLLLLEACFVDCGHHTRFRRICHVATESSDVWHACAGNAEASVNCPRLISVPQVTGHAGPFREDVASH